MAHGTHDFEDDARNERILIWVNGELVPRERAVVSVFDAGFVLGDGVWEGCACGQAIPPSWSAISTASSRARRPSCSTSAAAAAS